MLPSIVASELQQAIRDFLQATFPMTTPGFRRDDGRSMVDDFLDQTDQLFQGPFVSLGLPFREYAGGRVPLRHIELGFKPYLHQAAAFDRLCADPPLVVFLNPFTGRRGGRLFPPA